METAQTATETKPSLTLAEIAEIAETIAAERAFDYAGNYGRGTFRFAVKVRVDYLLGPKAGGDGALVLLADCNAQISSERARAELREVWVELLRRIEGRTDGFARSLHRGGPVWSTGFWHMGRWCVDGYARGLRSKRAA